ncbi:MAG: polyphosphate:AMP phosphotransferase [Gemmatimonadota bacterium]|nr:polyphosphate:AMP phosphotransferase [Gemmatimonadota bacterium]
MFEAAEVGNKLDKATFKREAPGVRAALLAVQRRIAGSELAPVILISGAEGAGKGETVGLLHAWMDARGLETHVLWDETDEERERPEYWRYWRTLPPRGKIGIFFGSWYTRPIVDRVFGRIDDATFERTMRRVRDFERMLTLEGYPILKYWLHLSKKAERKRIKELRADPRMKWRLSRDAKKFFKHYDDFRRVSEGCVRLTSTGFAPWTVVEATNDAYRNLTVTTSVLHALEEALDEVAERARAKTRKARLPKAKKANILRRLDLTQSLSGKAYDTRLATAQAGVGRLARKLRKAERSLILVLEGPDAGGKGGAIRRVTAAMNPYLYRVIGIAAPTDEEAAHPYLWRFWRHLPRRGRVTIYDRSWYGRVLVERIEGFARPDEWRRAFTEINDFEQQLAEAGTLTLKFWLAISAKEQLRRFKDRQGTPYKQYKITADDWRNRAKWNAYEAAACDMIERTSTDVAPWVLVEADDKKWARVKVLETIHEHLRAAL